MVIGQRIDSAKFNQEDILQDIITPTSKMDNSQDNSSAAVGKNLRSVVLRADLESRLVVGLAAAVKQLSVLPEETLFCILVTPKQGDSATHMQEVLLKAFCFENDIYIIQVDSAEKLARLLNVAAVEPCVLVQKTRQTGQKEVFTPAEDALIDFCEEYWDVPEQPIVRLPETVDVAVWDNLDKILQDIQVVVELATALD